ncbi:uncharacterized protein LOC110621436 [Manihot esculenta]|uniref:uncharacterized protein LOC110621436 n=1 Tax=Manihot esculenta TaxID=3983 RepID=UPI000B5D0E07|nr:uncharacterized protein LOC110621436 [Manihot esculenta]
MLAWSIEISPYCLEYRPRITIKSQALADFIAECSFNEKQAEPGETSSGALEGERERQSPQEFSWKLYVDRASSAGGSGTGIMPKGPEGFKVCYALCLEFNASNNVAEYEALINGMLIAMEVGATDLEINSDSQLVISQITGAYQARDPTMQNYLARVKAIEAELGSQGIMVRYQRIPREENEEADLLSRLSEEELEQLPDKVYIQHISAPAFEKANTVMEIEEKRNWMTPYLDYLEKGKLPKDKAEAKKIAARAANYQAVRGTLYRRGKSSPWLRCVSPKEAVRVMEEIHQGICGAHEGAGTLANKIFRQGYYWPTVKREAEEFIRRCDVCQRFANAINVPATPQSSISSPWPFSQWGINILGPFPKTTGQKKFVIVAVEYFSKWPEAEAVPTITARKMIDFVWATLYAGLAYRGCSYQTMAGNLTAMLSGNSREIWGYGINSPQTAPRTLTKETPFALAFGTEAVVPIELQVPTHRVQFNSENTNRGSERRSLDSYRCISTEGSSLLQPKSQGKELEGRRPSIEKLESHWKKSCSGKNGAYLGEPFQNNQSNQTKRVSNWGHVREP